jgi:hypothetical protein
MKLTPHELQTLRTLLTKALDAAPVQRACRWCGHWESGACQKWKATPPADVQQVGCAAWEFDPDSAPF